MSDQFRDPQYKTADGSALRIWRAAAQNSFLTEREGRPVFDDVTYVEVISPGSHESSPVFEVRRVFDKELNFQELPLYGIKWPTYKEFVAKYDNNDEVDGSMAGTPLEQWPAMGRTLAASLKAQGVFTVDALAVLPDTRLLILGPDGRTWREKAKAYLEAAKGSAGATALAAQLSQRDDELADTRRQLAELAGTVASLQAQLGGAPAPPPPEQPPADII